MIEETTIKTGGEEGTTIQTGGTSVTTGAPIERTITEYILYKIDRSIAIAGLITIGIWALTKGTPEAMQIAGTVAGVLGGYIGGRNSNK